MKKLTFLLLFLIPLLLCGQDYKLLTATSKKLYSTISHPQTAYSLSIESAKMIGIDSVYYNFFELDDEWIESDTCYFWGSPYCNKQNQPGWLGPRIEFDNKFSYRFYNLNHDTLHFSFNTEADGPIPFYSDNIQEFSILYEKDDTLTLFGQSDSARYFQVIHTDLDGNSIDSPLNGYDLIISKQFGLANFFEVDSFPYVLKPLKIIGNMNPFAGFYRITNEMVYNHQPGDEMQFNEYHHYEPNVNPPWYNYNRYRKWTFLNREETNDSLLYTLKQELFYIDSVGIETDTLTLKYLRFGIIAQIPFEKFNKNHRTLGIVDYCEDTMWRYTLNATEDIGYCEADTCWGTIDLGHPPEQTHQSIVLGLGNYENRIYVVGPDGYDLHDRVVYFKKDGIECGSEVVVAIDENKALNDKITVSPNPVQDEATISSPIKIDEVKLIDSFGKLLFIKASLGKQTKINMTGFENGIYYLNLKFKTGHSVTKKIIVLH